MKKCLNRLHEEGLVHEEVSTLPKNDYLIIKLNTYFTKPNEDYMFAQLPHIVFNKVMIEELGNHGVRILYFIRSYINSVEFDSCWTSIDTISKQTGISRNTVMKYIQLLDEKKLIKTLKKEIDTVAQYIYYDKNGNERVGMSRYNNNYFIKMENIEKLHDKLIQNRNLMLS